MAIYVKCSSCGELYNELIHDRCPNCGSELRDVIPSELRRYDDNDLSESKRTDSTITQNETNDETNSQQPFNEIPEFYSDVYNLIFKKDKKNWKLLLVMIAELLIGFAFTYVGYILIAHNTLYRGSTAGMFASLIGIVALMHSFHSIIKHSILSIIRRKKDQKTEQRTSIVLFITELVLGLIIIIIIAFTGIDDVFVVLGLGLVIGAIWSLVKYLTRNRVKRKMKE